MKHRFFIEVIYDDNSQFDFHVELEGEEHEWHATLNMITRGTLMASIATKATAYNEEGFEVVSYIQNH